MKLIHSEIDVTPDTPTSLQVSGPGIKRNAGTAMLELSNATEAINTFSVWVSCPDHPWLERIATVSRLDNPNSNQVGDRKEGGKYYAQAQKKDVRKIAVTFPVRKTAEARAGVYDATVEVDSEVAVDGRLRRSFPVRIVVRPYFDWEVKLEPKEKTFGKLRRTQEYELVIENRGNDWQYFDLRSTADGKEIKVETETSRVAVPPAASPDHPTRRVVPVKVRHWKKGVSSWIGSTQPAPLPISATRVDAPSVARFPEAGPQSGDTTPITSLGLGTSVLVQTTDQTKSPAGAKANYRPWVPKSIPDFANFLKHNALMLFAIFILGCLAFYTLAFMLATVKNRTRVQIYADINGSYEQLGATDTVPPGAEVRVTGQDIRGADVTVLMGEENVSRECNLRFDTNLDAMLLSFPKKFAGKSMKVHVARRAYGWLPLPGMPSLDTPTVKVAGGDVKIVPPEIFNAPLSVLPGERVRLDYRGVPGKVEVRLNGEKISPLVLSLEKAGKPGHVEFKLPDDLVKKLLPVTVSNGDKTATLQPPLTVSETPGLPIDSNALPIDDGTGNDPRGNNGNAVESRDESPYDPSTGGRGEGGSASTFAMPAGYRKVMEGVEGENAAALADGERAAREAGGKAGYAVAALAAYVLNHPNDFDAYSRDMEKADDDRSAFTHALVYTVFGAKVARQGGTFKDVEAQFSLAMGELEGKKGCALPALVAARICGQLGQSGYEKAYRKTADRLR